MINDAEKPRKRRNPLTKFSREGYAVSGKTSIKDRANYRWRHVSTVDESEKNRIELFYKRKGKQEGYDYKFEKKGNMYLVLTKYEGKDHIEKYERKGLTREPTAQELAFWCINDAQLYHSMTKSIIHNNAVKIVKKIYDQKKAVISWISLVEEGISNQKVKYPGNYQVDKSIKTRAAKIVQIHYQNELEKKARELYEFKIQGKDWQRRTS
jgi:hypothetical protein